LIKNPPVEKSLIVLDTLSSSTAGVHVNQIVRATGSKDRKEIIRCIDFLEKAEIIRTVKTRGSQKELKILTDIGMKMAALRDGIVRYRKAYLQLNHAMRKNFGIATSAPDTVIKNRLLAREWKPTEISSYRGWAKAATQLQSESSTAFILALFAKYIRLLSRITITSGNPLQQVVLTRIFTDALNDHFAAMSAPKDHLITSVDVGEWIILDHVRDIAQSVDIPDFIVFPPEPPLNARALSALENPARKFVNKYSKMSDPPMPLKNNKFIKDEAAEVIASIRYFMDPTSSKNNNNRRHHDDA
jgi:hypothetical protein